MTHFDINLDRYTSQEQSYSIWLMTLGVGVGRKEVGLHYLVILSPMHQLRGKCCDGGDPWIQRSRMVPPTDHVRWRGKL